MSRHGNALPVLPHRAASRRWGALVGAGILAISLATVGSSGTAAAAPPTPAAPAAGSGAAPAISASAGRAGAGHTLRAAVAAKPRTYTAAQLKELNAQMLETDEMDKGYPTVRPPAGALNAATPRPNRLRQATSVLRDSIIPRSGINGGSNYASFTQEPSTDANGGNIFQTGNWYATRSVNNGASWSYLDPFTLFGTGFCCDQVTQYDAPTGRQFWLLQFGDHLVLANASAAGTSAFTSWCYWNITPDWFGLPAGTSLDYNDIAITNSFVNISTNYFGASSNGAAIVRLPKYPMSHCAGFSYNRLNRSDNFTFKLVPSLSNTLYFGSNWGQTNGSSFRLFVWPENSASYTYYDRTVAPFTFYTRNSGQNCGSADGVVKNWCQFADSRVLGAYRAAGVIGFSFNVKQDAAHPFPYTRIVRFRESDKAYLGSGDLWGSWGAIQFLTLAPNTAGRAGGLFTWGGGTGTTHYYPGSATYSTPASSTSTDPNYFLFGGGNTCTYGGLYRWGDYLTVRTYRANPAQWVGATYAIKGGNCGSSTAYAEPHNVLFQ